MMFTAVFDRLRSSLFPTSSTYAPVPTDMAEEKDDDELKHNDAQLESFELDNDVDDEVERRLVKKLDRRILPSPASCISLLVRRPFLSLVFNGFNSFNMQSLTAPIWAMLASKDFLRTLFTATQPASSLTGSHLSFTFLTCVTQSFFFLVLGFQVCSIQILCQVPATVVSKLFPPRIWLGAAAIGWGLCSTLMVCIISSHNEYKFTKIKDKCSLVLSLVHCIQLYVPLYSPRSSSAYLRPDLGLASPCICVCSALSSVLKDASNISAILCFSRFSFLVHQNRDGPTHGILVWHSRPSRARSADSSPLGSSTPTQP